MSKSLWVLAACAATLMSVRADDKKDEKADAVVKIVHVESGKVLAVEGDSEENEAHCTLAKDEDNEARRWKVVKDGEWLKVVHVKSGKVLDVNNVSTEEGAHLIIWDDKGTDGIDNQRFQWDGKGEERRLKAKNSSLVLDADGDGHVIQKKADEKSKKQLWKVVEVKAKK
jgi:Ricin-type beta-trefoil lectin domain-like